MSLWEFCPWRRIRFSLPCELSRDRLGVQSLGCQHRVCLGDKFTKQVVDSCCNTLRKNLCYQMLHINCTSS